MCSVLGWAVYFCLLSIHINWLAPEEAPAQPSPLTAVQYCIGIVCYWPGPSTSNTVRYHSPASDVQHCGATKCLYPIIEYKISEWPSLVRSMVSMWSADKILVPGPRSVFLILCFSSHINIDIFSWILLSSGFRYSYLYTYLTSPVRPSRFSDIPVRLYQDDCSCCCAAEEFSCRVSAGRWTDINTAAAATMTLNRERVGSDIVELLVSVSALSETFNTLMCIVVVISWFLTYLLRIVWLWAI